MKCDRFEELIALYIDNELPEEDKKALEQHIKECGNCRQQFQALNYMKHNKGMIEEEIKPPGNLRKKIYFKIYRDLLIMFAGLVIIISVAAISGGLAQMMLFDNMPGGIRALFTGGMLLLICGLLILLYDIFIDMFKILTKK